ncbi:phage tail length tape measure family protein, partial [Pseudomonas sp. PS02290]|uniref:phage tail length tape measure family protein n=1 Tax=Pseudomonas sp. PS02290 TaxID=2991430 RepID=UPI00249C8828
MAQTSRLVLEIDSRDAEQKAADTRKALEALEGAGLRVKPAMDRASDGLEEVGQSADKAGAQVKEQRASLEALLGSIDPVTRKLGELDRQEKELARNRKLGLIDTDTFNDYQGKINTTRADLGRFNADMTRTGITAKQTAAALRGVPAQFTDIAVSLQGGQAPLTVFLQQGGQLKDMFGGAGPAAKALGGYVLGLINPFTVAAAAVTALGVAYYQGSKEQDAYRIALVTTGNAAGTSTLALAEMAKRISATVGTTGEAAAALALLAGNGKIT